MGKRACISNQFSQCRFKFFKHLYWVLARHWGSSFSVNILHTKETHHREISYSYVMISGKTHQGLGKRRMCLGNSIIVQKKPPEQPQKQIQTGVSLSNQTENRSRSSVSVQRGGQCSGGLGPSLSAGAQPITMSQSRK